MLCICSGHDSPSHEVSLGVVTCHYIKLNGVSPLPALTHALPVGLPQDF